ncbi:hypothetical protein LCGC14_1242700, partial [marine sediment metagenome]
MRTLPAYLLAEQKELSLNILYKAQLTLDAADVTYEQNRIIAVPYHIEEPFH